MVDDRLTENARKRQRNNILQKLRDGKTLTLDERQQIGIDARADEDPERQLESLRHLRQVIAEHQQTSSVAESKLLAQEMRTASEAIELALRRLLAPRQSIDDRPTQTE